MRLGGAFARACSYTMYGISMRLDISVSRRYVSSRRSDICGSRRYVFSRSGDSACYPLSSTWTRTHYASVACCRSVFFPCRPFVSSRPWAVSLPACSLLVAISPAACNLHPTRITLHAYACHLSAQALCTNLVLGRARRTLPTLLLSSLALHQQRPAEHIHPWYLRLSISHCLLPNTMHAATVASQASG